MLLWSASKRPEGPIDLEPQILASSDSDTKGIWLA